MYTKNVDTPTSVVTSINEQVGGITISQESLGFDKELAENKKRVKEERRKRGTNKNSIQKTTKVSAKRNTLNSVKSSITIKPKKSSTIKRSRTTIKHSKPH